MRSPFALALAVVLDLVTLGLVTALLWRGLVPRELGAGMLGAVIGARARWLADGPGPTAPPPASLPPPETSGSARRSRSDIAREALHESVLGALFWPVFRRA